MMVPDLTLPEKVKWGKKSKTGMPVILVSMSH